MNVIINLALIAVAWLGHAFLLTVALNVIYGRPWQRTLLRLIRHCVAVLVFGFPIAAWFLFDSLTVQLYLCWCTFIGGAVLPALTILRLFRHKAPELIDEQARVVDFAERFGRNALGYGKHWRLARIPGNQLLQVEFAERTFRLARLPATWDGLTILHLSDLHFHGTPEREFFHAVVDQCRQWGTPDLVCLTGDFLDSIRHQCWIVPILGKLRWKEAGFAILGNHDYWYDPPRLRRRLRRIGFRVLENTWTQIEIRGKPVVVVGHEGPWFGPGPRLEDAPIGPFRLCLSHTPDNIRWARQNAIDVMLSGHTHGGQVRVPILESLFVPSRYSRKYDAGTFSEPPTLLYVSRGLSGREPLRLNCRPEATWIVLRTAEALVKGQTNLSAQAQMLD